MEQRLTMMSKFGCEMENVRRFSSEVADWPTDGYTSTHQKQVAPDVPLRLMSNFNIGHYLLI
jgi:hypothetical protein